MPRWMVKFKAETEVDVEANTAGEAQRLARKQLDPDTDWDETETRLLRNDGEELY